MRWAWLPWAVGVLALVAAASRAPAPLPPPTAPRSVPERPAPCHDVAPGELQAALDAAADGDALCLQDGRHVGPIRIASPVTIWGSLRAVIATSGSGTTVEVDAAGVRLLGFTVDGSGGRFDIQDAAVHVGADKAVLEGLRVQNAVFGLLVEKASGVIVRGNEVAGPDRGPLGLRGDGIRLWETRRSLVEGNLVTGSRDLVVWYSPDNIVRGNVVLRSRYGTHLMHSSGVTVEDNSYRDNVVGVFVMYSQDVRVIGNTVQACSGAAGIGVGLKESGNVLVERNALLDDTVGLFVDTSPIQRDDLNVARGNLIAGCDIGVTFHRSETSNVFEGNVFRDNRASVAVEGGGDALRVTWKGNDFDDYRGYDFDRDGVGDVPHELRTFTGHLESRRPELAFLRGTASAAIVEAGSTVLPLFEPRTILIDEEPRVRAFGGELEGVGAR